MRMEKKNKAFAYRVPIGDYNYLQCIIQFFSMKIEDARAGSDHLPLAFAWISYS